LAVIALAFFSDNFSNTLVILHPVSVTTYLHIQS